MTVRGASIRSFALFVTLAVTLAACGVAPPESGRGQSLSLSAWQPPEAPQSWRLSGRAAVRTSEDSGTVTLSWRETASGYRVDLRAPMAAGAVRIEGDAEMAVLSTASGERYHGTSPRDLLWRAAGYDLPVEYLRWWLRGLAVPGVEGRVTVNAEGAPIAFEQAGWRVSLSDYRPVAEFLLPHRVSVSGDEASARIAVARWSALE